MWPKFGNSSVSRWEIITISILQGFDQKNHFFWGMVLVQVQPLFLRGGLDSSSKIRDLKFYTSVAKGLKLKLRMFLR